MACTASARVSLIRLREDGYRGGLRIVSDGGGERDENLHEVVALEARELRRWGAITPAELPVSRASHPLQTRNSRAIIGGADRLWGWGLPRSTLGLEKRGYWSTSLTVQRVKAYLNVTV